MWFLIAGKVLGVGQHMGKLHVGDFILLAIALVIGLALAPVVSSAAATAAENATALTATMLALVPFVYVAVLIIAAVSYLVYSFKQT